MMKFNRILFVAVALLALTACGDENKAVQWWDWTTEEPEPGPDPVVEDANPGLIKLGWANVGDEFGELPNYINVYRAGNISVCINKLQLLNDLVFSLYLVHVFSLRF